MIYFVVSRYKGDEEIYKKYVSKSLTKLGITSIEVEDGPEKLSLTHKYNLGITKLINELKIGKEDIVVFCHSDVEILDDNFEQKIQMVFQNFDDIGLLGVIGANEFHNHGMWWSNTPEKLYGHIIQQNGEQEFHLKKKVEFNKNVVVVDGLIMAIRGELLLNGLKFDERYSFDFYDIDMCFQVLEMGKMVAIADILVKHASPGMGALKQDWRDGRKIFFDKWNKMSFPYSKG